MLTEKSVFTQREASYPREFKCISICWPTTWSQ